LSGGYLPFTSLKYMSEQHLVEGFRCHAGPIHGSPYRDSAEVYGAQCFQRTAVLPNRCPGDASDDRFVHETSCTSDGNRGRRFYFIRSVRVYAPMRL
jgi:hypothetical protein